MDVLPPSGSSPLAVGSPQDDEGAALYQQLQNLDIQPFQPLVNAILAKVEGPPYDAAAIKQQMDTVFSTIYGTSMVTHDAYMEFGLSSTMMDLFMTGINSAIPNDPYSLPSSLQFTSMDAYCGGLFDFIFGGPSDMQALAKAFLEEVKLNLGSHATLDSGKFATILQNIMTDPNFFTNFPTVTPANIADFFAFAETGALEIPNYLPNYLAVGCNWPSTSAGDTDLQVVMLDLMRLGWKSASLSDLQMFASLEIQRKFADYPTVDLQGALNLEAALGVSAPELQPQFFETKALLAGLTPNTHAYGMAQDLMNEIISLWPAGDPAGLHAWYNGAYTTVDPFMKYYNVDTTDPTFANIEKFYQIGSGSSGTIQPTAADTQYREAANYRDTLDPRSADYTLINDLVSQWSTIGGSNPTPDQLRKITIWEEQVRSSPLFLNASQPVQNKFLSYISDPEGSDLYNKLVNLETTDPKFKPLIDAVLAGITVPPYDHIAILTQLSAVLSATYGSGVTHDAYMEFGLSDTDLADLVNNDVDPILKAHGDPAYGPPSITYTSADRAYHGLLNWLSSAPTDMQQLGTGLLNSIKANIGSAGDSNQIPGLFQNIFLDVNFFTNYPAVTPAAYTDLKAFAQQIGYTFPDADQDYALNYLQTGCNWPNPNANPDDAQLQKDVLALMREYWMDGGLQVVQVLEGGEINSQFADYPNLDLQGALNLETDLNISAPPLQSQFFTTKTWMASLTQGSPAYNMAQDLMNGITALYPDGDLKGWYNTNYGTVDLFMKYYNVDTTDPTFANIEKFYQIATGSTNTIAPTTMDSNYRQVAAYRDTFNKGTPDFNVMDGLCNHWAVYGSNPTVGDLQNVYKWAVSEIASKDFASATTKTQNMFLGFFGYNLTLSFFEQYLMTWGSYQAPQYQQDYARMLTSVINGFMKSHPNATHDDFQNYLNAGFSSNSYDYCRDFAGLLPEDINQVLSTINITSPYTYQAIDEVYGQCYRALDGNPPQADKDILHYILDNLEKSYQDPKNFPFDSFVLPDIYDAMSQPTWDNLQLSTQNALSTVFNAFPIEGAAGITNWLLQQVPAGSPDAKALNNLLVQLQLSIDDPVKNPYLSTVRDWIMTFEKTPEWNQLQPLSQDIFGMFANMFPVT